MIKIYRLFALYVLLFIVAVVLAGISFTLKECHGNLVKFA